MSDNLPDPRLEASVPRLQRQLDFLLQIDKLKTVERRSLLSDRSRRENSAEHSWHLARFVLCLAEYAAEPIDLGRALSIALLHDIVEVDAGDTFIYDDNSREGQRLRETRAAERLYGLLPAEQGQHLRGLWEEYEAGQSAEARLVRTLDRLEPLLLHRATDGVVWQEHGVRKSQVVERMAEIEQQTPALWSLVCEIIAEGVSRGRLIDE
jgi:putative hydrolase of HD superfamily